MFLAVSLFLLAQSQGEPTAPVLSLSPPAQAVVSGETIRVGVYFRNAGAEALPVTPPNQLDAEIVTSTARSPVALTWTGDAPPERKLAPGESLYVEYSLALPPEIAGRVVVQLVRQTASPAVIDIEKKQGDGVHVTSTPSDEPLDPDAAPPPPPAFRYAEGAMQRFSAYEPMYAVGGTDRPNIRFQFSFQYHVFNPEGPWVTDAPFLGGLFLGYTQTGLWDLEGASKPFTDTNYRPELAWSQDQLEWLKIPGVAQTGMQFGVQHESNGRDGEESRSINIAYIRPVFHFGDPKGFEGQVAPKAYMYLPDREDNPDISEYRGYCDLRVTAGWADGLQAAATGRLGSGGDHGSIQIDLTYPLRALGDGNLDLYLQIQWFSGYGESLITYDQYTDALRIGIGLVR